MLSCPLRATENYIYHCLCLWILSAICLSFLLSLSVSLSFSLSSLPSPSLLLWLSKMSGYILHAYWMCLQFCNQLNGRHFPCACSPAMMKLTIYICYLFLSITMIRNAENNMCHVCHITHEQRSSVCVFVCVCVWVCVCVPATRRYTLSLELGGLLT